MFVREEARDVCVTGKDKAGEECYRGRQRQGKRNMRRGDAGEM